METTLYDDSSFRSLNDNFKSLKRPVTLDLDCPTTKTKFQRVTELLTSPDLNRCKLASPEMEWFIKGVGSVMTPTPSQYLFPKNVTEEQKKYAKGFEDRLAQLHQTEEGDISATTIFNQLMENVSCSTGFSPISSAPRNYTGLLPVNLQSTSVSTAVITSKAQPVTLSNLMSAVRPPSVDSSSSSSFPGTISMSQLPKSVVKEELQTVPSDSSSMGISPPLSPINLEDQERIKLERKRYRNRIAASRCRQRKLEKISKLEYKVNELKSENAKLDAVADELRQQVCSLKKEVIDHVKHGCQIMMSRNHL